MVSFLKDWEDFDKKLEDAKNCFHSTQIDSHKQLYHKYLKLSCSHDSYIQYFYERYHFSTAYIKQWLSPTSPIFDLDEEKQYEMLDYYIKIFGSVYLFFKRINCETYYYKYVLLLYYCSPNYKFGIFTFKPPALLDIKLTEIQKYFKVTRRTAILMACNSAFLLTNTIETIDKNVKKFSNILEIDTLEFKEYCIRFPHILERYNLNLSHITTLAKHCHLSNENIIECIKNYPPFLLHSATSIGYYSSINVKYPFLKNLIYDKRTNKHYNLSEDFLSFIDSTYGKIEDADITHYKNIPFAYLVVKSNKSKGYLIFGIGDDNAYLEEYSRSYSLSNCNKETPKGFKNYEHYIYLDIKTHTHYKGYIFTCNTPLGEDFDFTLDIMLQVRYNDYRYYYREISS